MHPYKYEAVVAKCRSLIGSMIKPEQYKALLECQSVVAVAQYLCDYTSYGQVLVGTNISAIHRGQLEFLLNRELYNSFVKFYTFMNDEERSYIGYMTTRFEFEYLLTAFRIINTNHEHIFHDVPVFMASHSKIDFNKLYAATDNNGILGALENTEYYTSLASLLEKGDKAEYLKFEKNLYDNFFKSLYTKYAKALDRKSREITENIIGTQVDLINLVRITRMKMNFSYSWEDIVPYIIPIFHKLKEQEIKTMLSLNGEAYFEYVKTLYYGRKLDIRKYPSVSDYARIYLYTYYRRLLATYSSGFEVVLGYLFLKQNEINNLTTITEGIRYGIARPQLRSYLVGIE
ncbi:MAG: V-type ATPase subunit [Eubacteriales bacterium]